MARIYGPPKVPITRKCKYCGRTDIWGRGTNPLFWAQRLTIWEVCDELDQATGKYIVACDKCESKIEDSDTLYEYKSTCAGDFCPGAMPQCTNCRFRKGLVCHHPDRWTSGVVYQPAPTMKEAGFHFSPHKWNFNKMFTDYHTCQSRAGITKSPSD